MTITLLEWPGVTSWLSWSLESSHSFPKLKEIHLMDQNQFNYIAEDMENIEAG